MTDVQLDLGGLRFSMSSTEYETLEKVSRWRWVKYDRVNRRPGLQFQGPGSRDLVINGKVYADSPSHVHRLSDIEDLGDTGKPLRLISGSQVVGRDWGLWSMLELTNKHEHIYPDGTPHKQTFTIRLQDYGADNN